MGDETREMYRKTLGIAETVALARKSDPSTSREAAQSVKLTKLESLVLAEFERFQYGTTTVEVADRLGLGRDSVSPRARPLRDKGQLFDTGRTVKGPTGRKLTVWITKANRVNIV